MFTLRPEQRTTVDKAKEILRQYAVVYLAGEMRVGKSVMAITTFYELGFKNLCFITKKINIPNVEEDKIKCSYPIIVDVFSMDSIHKITKDYEAFIVDENHAASGAYPIASKRAKAIRELTVGIKPKYGKNKPVILMSGTPAAESYSQFFHQFWLSYNSPFKQYSSFYRWADDYCKKYEYPIKNEDGTITIGHRVKQKFVYGQQLNDYSEAIKEKVQEAIHPYFVSLTQRESGFESFVEESILSVPIDARLYKLMKILKRDKVYTMKCGDTIVADTPTRLQQVFHQLSGGTIKVVDPVDPNKAKRHILDRSKAYYIRSRFAGQKIAIYYKYIAEGQMLREVFENHTEDQHEFNSREDKIFICQYKRGSMGVNLKTADCMVMYTIDFSASDYWQIRARMQSHDRKKAAKLYWAFSEHGIEKKIYEVVMDKRDYTVSLFKKDFLSNKLLLL